MRRLLISTTALFALGALAIGLLVPNGTVSAALECVTPPGGDCFTGPVGIGTTNPHKPLSVTSGSSGHQAIFGQDLEEEEGFVGIVIGHSDASNSSGNIAYDLDNNFMALQIGGDPLRSALVIADDSRVGIGTTEPKNKLDVRGSDGPAVINARQEEQGGGLNTEAQFASSAFGLRLSAVGKNGALAALHAQASDGAKAAIFSGNVVVSGSKSRVGIGTTKPKAQLDVRGKGGRQSIRVEHKSKTQGGDSVKTEASLGGPYTAVKATADGPGSTAALLAHGINGAKAASFVGEVIVNGAVKLPKGMEIVVDDQGNLCIGSCS